MRNYQRPLLNSLVNKWTSKMWKPAWRTTEEQNNPFNKGVSGQESGVKYKIAYYPKEQSNKP